MSDTRVAHPGLGIARCALLLLPLASTACNGSPVDPGDNQEPLQIVAEEQVTMAESPQLLLNGGMEGGSSSPESWWTGGTSASDFILEWSDGVAASGSRGLTVRQAGGATEFFSYWAQSLDVENPFGMTFELSVSIKLEDVQGEGVSIAIRGDQVALGNDNAEAFATTQGRGVIDGTRDWATYTVRLDGIPATIDRITVYLIYLPNNTGTVYFDDATLSVSETVPTVALQNTDMEEGGSYPVAWWSGGAGSSNYEFEWSTTEASSGLRSLGIARAAPHPEEFGFWAQTIDAANFVGGPATLTVRINSEGLVGEGAAIAIRTDDTPRPQGSAEGFATTQGSQPIVGRPGWETHQVTLQFVPVNTESVTVYLLHLTSTSGAIYFDQVSLVPG